MAIEAETTKTLESASPAGDPHGDAPSDVGRGEPGHAAHEDSSGEGASEGRSEIAALRAELDSVRAELREVRAELQGERERLDALARRQAEIEAQVGSTREPRAEAGEGEGEGDDEVPTTEAPRHVISRWVRRLDAPQHGVRMADNFDDPLPEFEGYL